MFVKKENLQLSIVIPILNESDNIKKLIPRIYKSIKKIKLKKIQILLIDDNSQDDIDKEFRNLKKKFKSVYLFKRKTKRDLSKSCILGFDKSIAENILVMDGDLQHDPKYIPSLYYKLVNENLDFVIGSRNLIKKGRRGLGLIRYISSIVLILVINFFLGKETSDPMSGYFIFKKKIYKSNKKYLYKQGYKILADLIYSSKKKLKIGDVDINFKLRNSGKSKMNLGILLKLIIFVIEKTFK
tara:strand:- start:264 stop:986 length:723 start_codon:yes stop_codon:yes gene_type:complete